MNKLAVQRQSRPLLPELSQLFTGLPAFAGLRPFFENHVMRLEDETKEGLYEVRAELPGVDPISMLIEMVPLLALFELSILIARAFGRPGEAGGMARPSTQEQ